MIDMDIYSLIQHASVISLIIVAVWIVIVDLRKLVIPNKANLAVGLIGVILVYTAPLEGMSAFSGLLGACIVAGFLFLVGEIMSRIKGRTTLGFGDVKLGFAAGFWVGYEESMSYVWLSSITSLGIYLWITIRRYRIGKPPPRYLAFGPGMVIALVALVLGRFFRIRIGLTELELVL